jgi:hypothetical protein
VASARLLGGDAVNIFNVENWLALKESVVAVAFVELCALFVDGEVCGRANSWKHLESVLEANADAGGMGSSREEVEVINIILLSDIKAILIVISV